MCGIFGILNMNALSNLHVQREFDKGASRGPESHKSIVSPTEFIGFHRLAINGLDASADQPLCLRNNKLILICNGEIYNYRELLAEVEVTPYSNSDCEVILYMYEKYGFEHMVRQLDGVFSFALFDFRAVEQPLCYIARDPLGIRPLYWLEINSPVDPKRMSDSHIPYKYFFASELKCLETFHETYTYDEYKHDRPSCAVSYGQFQPGTYRQFQLNVEKDRWSPVTIPSYSPHHIPYFIPVHAIPDMPCMTNSEIFTQVDYLLTSAVRKRCLTTDRPIACLLSGGLDSSLITALVDEQYRLQAKTRNNGTTDGLDKRLQTYSIGLEGSEDLRNARVVAEYLDTEHTEVIISEDTVFAAIPEVVRVIESYDVTTVRASIGNYLIGKYISGDTNAKVIFNGDGSDELFGGYLYMNDCPDAQEFDRETRRLLKDIHLFDVLRSDKCISSHGLEPRTPFLDRNVVNGFLSIDYRTRYMLHKKGGKHTLRSSFEGPRRLSAIHGRPLLPNSVLYRKKEAFSDGVSQQSRSLFTIIQEHIQIDPRFKEYTGVELEKRYYQYLFDKFYPNMKSIVPYAWMPKYNAYTDDPSARTLQNYHEPHHP